VVTLRLGINERAHQDQLRRADERARRVEADHQQEIKVQEERAANEREEQLNFAANVRQARRVAAFIRREVSTDDEHPEMVKLVNGSDYPIFDIILIGARLEFVDGSTSDKEWPPEMRLETSDFLNVEILQPGEHHVFRGSWRWRQFFILTKGLAVRRPVYTWTDDEGRSWQRDGSKPPALLNRPWVWTEIWRDVEYLDEPIRTF
jgi:hypothetical protein